MTERLYYRDAFLTRFTARVEDIREVSRQGGRQVWQVSLDRSAFYPDSGGQPHDLGTLTARSVSGAVLAAAVSAVAEDGDGTVWHSTEKPLLAGTEIEGEIDWARRLDHMQQHSGQHLLSACFLRELGAATVSFHLGDEVSSIDLALADGVDALDGAEVERVSVAGNLLVAEDRAMRVHFVSPEQARAMLADGRLRKLPEREGEVRVIEMEGVEWNACGGTHVSSAGQIGGIAVRGMERIRRGVVRVEFACGLRAARLARRDYSLVRQVAAAVSSTEEGLPEAVRGLSEQVKAGGKERLRILSEMAGLEAQVLLGGASEGGLLEAELAGKGAEYLKMVALEMVKARAGIVVLMNGKGEADVPVVLACGAGAGVRCGEVMRASLEAMGLRGGGSATLAQGSVPAGRWEELRETLRAGIGAGLGAGQDRAG
jgi:alanyl-tRNA synthetase